MVLGRLIDYYRITIPRLDDGGTMIERHMPSVVKKPFHVWNVTENPSPDEVSGPVNTALRGQSPYQASPL